VSLIHDLLLLWLQQMLLLLLLLLLLLPFCLLSLLISNLIDL